MKNIVLFWVLFLRDPFAVQAQCHPSLQFLQDSCYSGKAIHWYFFSTYDSLLKFDKVSTDKMCIGYYPLDTNNFAGVVFESYWGNPKNYLFLYHILDKRFVIIRSLFHSQSTERIVLRDTSSFGVTQMLGLPQTVAIYEKRLATHNLIFKPSFSKCLWQHYFYQEDSYKDMGYQVPIDAFGKIYFMDDRGINVTNKQQISFDNYLKLVEAVIRFSPSEVSIKPKTWKKTNFSFYLWGE